MYNKVPRHARLREKDDASLVAADEDVAVSSRFNAAAIFPHFKFSLIFIGLLAASTAKYVAALLFNNIILHA